MKNKKIKKGDTVEILRCGFDPKHKFNGETGVVGSVEDYGVWLKNKASCDCNYFNFDEISLVNKTFEPELTKAELKVIKEIEKKGYEVKRK